MLDSTIVIYSAYSIRSFVLVGSVFPVWVLFDHNGISYTVPVWNAYEVFSFVVLYDKLLLTFFDVLPVGFERHVEDGVTTEH